MKYPKINCIYCKEYPDIDLCELYGDINVCIEIFGTNCTDKRENPKTTEDLMEMLKI